MAQLRRKKRDGGTISQATALKEEHEEVMKKVPAGEGGRFQALKSELSRKKGVKTPGALAAWIGRRKYGKAGFQKMAAKGKKGR
jgi:hypothetical protein